ncbi:MAG: MBL fold metallo-hydrolase [Hyphomicrobiaceae bacterium]
MRFSLFASSRRCGAAATVALTALVACPAHAQRPAADRCLALAANPQRPPVVQVAALKPYQARLVYNGHSTFTIESPKGVTIATDYNDIVGPAFIPTIVTMNVAHGTHYTTRPSAKIKHILRGWNPIGPAPAIHDLTVRDLRVRNVPTSIRTSDDGSQSRPFGNSIFIVEVAGLCIAHLGHLHHTLTTQQLAQIGQMDIALVPIDGAYTLDTAGVFDVLNALKPRIVLPMHYFSNAALTRFLDRARQDYEIVRQQATSVVISRDRLPETPRVIVLYPGG